MSSGHRGKGVRWYTRQEVLSRFVGTAKELKDKRLMIYCFRHTQGYSAACCRVLLRPLPLFGAAWRPHLLYPLCGLKPSVPSRPLTPSPPFRRGGGVATHTSFIPFCGLMPSVPSRPLLPLFGAAWRPHLLYPLCEGGGGVHRLHRHPPPHTKDSPASSLRRVKRCPVDIEVRGWNGTSAGSVIPICRDRKEIEDIGYLLHRLCKSYCG